jgi:hypothetical protein
VLLLLLWRARGRGAHRQHAGRRGTHRALWRRRQRAGSSLSRPGLPLLCLLCLLGVLLRAGPGVLCLLWPLLLLLLCVAAASCRLVLIVGVGVSLQQQQKRGAKREKAGVPGRLCQ